MADESEGARATDFSGPFTMLPTWSFSRAIGPASGRQRVPPLMRGFRRERTPAGLRISRQSYDHERGVRQAADLRMVDLRCTEGIHVLGKRAMQSTWIP